MSIQNNFEFNHQKTTLTPLGHGFVFTFDLVDFDRPTVGVAFRDVHPDLQPGEHRLNGPVTEDEVAFIAADTEAPTSVLTFANPEAIDRLADQLVDLATKWREHLATRLN